MNTLLKVLILCALCHFSLSSLADDTQCLDYIASHEGCVLNVYTDTTGHPTVCIGHLITNHDFRTYTENECKALFKSDVARLLPIAERFVNNWNHIGTARQCVLADMAYNMGYGLDQFSNFRGALEKGQYDAAANDLSSSLWFRQVGHRAVQDQEVLRSGKLPNVGFPHCASRSFLN